MTDNYRGGVCDPIDSQEVDRPAPQDPPEAIRHFPAGAYLTTAILNCDDIVLSGWVGLGKPGFPGDSLIGVLLPGDRIGAILDGRLCSGVALTPVSLITEWDNTGEPLEFRHLVRQCIRTCHFGASERIEDFFRETYERLEAVELAWDWTFDFPLSQATLGNILGLSTAHVNRVIKQLQVEGRIQILGRTVTLVTPESVSLPSHQHCLV